MAAGPFARVLIGYIPTDPGADARAFGVDLAAACGADIVLASVVSAVWIENIGEQSGPAVVHSGDRDRAAAALKEAAEKIAGEVGHVERQLEASRSPARGLHDLAVAEHADAIVVGSSHRGPLGRVIAGAVGERLLSGAPCAVAVATRGYAEKSGRGFRTVAVAFDGSPESRLALRAAHALAARCGATLTALMVVEPLSPQAGQLVPLPKPEGQEFIEPHEAAERQDRAAERTLGDAVAELGPGVEIRHEVRFASDPLEPILELAGEADLLVMGSRGYGPVHGALVGSVSTHVLRHAECPVLVTPRAYVTSSR